jgi:hypothetical protein
LPLSFTQNAESRDTQERVEMVSVLLIWRISCIRFGECISESALHVFAWLVVQWTVSWGCFVWQCENKDSWLNTQRGSNSLSDYAVQSYEKRGLSIQVHYATKLYGFLCCRVSNKVICIVLYPIYEAHPQSTFPWGRVQKRNTCMEIFIATDTPSVQLFFNIFATGIETFVIPWDQLLYTVS